MTPYSKFKLTDRKAPRFRGQRFNFINRNLYDKFLEENSRFSIEWDDFRFINYEINKEIIQQVVTNREGIILPKGMGRLWLGLFPPNRRYLVETGNIEFNFHSSNMKGKICWDYDHVKYKIDNHDFYGFIAHRDFKGEASRAFKNRGENFMRIDNIIRAYESYKAKKLKENERIRLDNTLSDQSNQSTT